MIDRDDDDRDLTSLTVVRVGRLAQSGDVWQPWRLLDPAGEVVDPVAAWLRDLQAAGRSALTQRSYGMDLLRWFRFLWAVDVAWNHATRAEARDFARWVRMTDKPRSPSADAGIPNPVTGKPNSGNKYAASTTLECTPYVWTNRVHHLSVTHRLIVGVRAGDHVCQMCRMWCWAWRCNAHVVEVAPRRAGSLQRR